MHVNYRNSIYPFKCMVQSNPIRNTNTLWKRYTQQQGGIQLHTFFKKDYQERPIHLGGREL